MGVISGTLVLDRSPACNVILLLVVTTVLRRVVVDLGVLLIRSASLWPMSLR